MNKEICKTDGVRICPQCSLPVKEQQMVRCPRCNSSLQKIVGCGDCKGCGLGCRP